MAQAKALFMTVKTALRRLFSTRNIIIISEKKIDHVAISPKWQFACIGAVLALIGWGGYCTGNAMAAHNALQEKERRIEAAKEEKLRVDRAYSLLRHDMQKMGQGKKTSANDEYSQYVVAQYGKADGDEAPKPEAAALAPGKDPATERVAFLEKQLEAAKKENEQFIANLRQKTAGKIGEYEDIIDMTGLGNSQLKRVVSLQEEDKKTSKPNKKRFANQGGPFIPADTNSMGEEQGKLKKDIDKLLKLNKLVQSLPLASPVGHREVSSTFGRRTDPINGRLAMHTGIDFRDPIGTVIRAPNDGRVIFADRKGAYGNVVDISHGYGVSTRYAHLQKILVQEGQLVKKGDKIATLGNTGRSTGAHLHYEVRYHDQPYNPARFLEAGNHVLQAKH